MFIEFPILSVIPANHERNVPLDTLIKIKFAQAMDDATITPNNVYIVSDRGVSVASEITYVPATREVILEPVAPLESGRSYRLVVLGGTGGVQSLIGDFLLETKYYDFQAEVVTVLPPSEEPVDPENPANPGEEPSEPGEEPSQPIEEPTQPINPVFGFVEVVGTYPAHNDANITPEAIKVLFSSPIKATSIHPETVYLIKKKKPSTLNVMDLLVDFSPTNNVLPTSTMTLEKPNLLSIQIEDPLEPNTEYTVVLRESIRGEDGSSLGEVYAFSFISKLSPLYGDPNRIRADIQGVLRNTPDSTLYLYMHEASMEADRLLELAGNPISEGGEVPYFVHQYVRYQASYDLILNSSVSTGTSSAGTRKLGDLTITQESGTSTDLSGILKELKDRIKPIIDQLLGRTNRGYAKPSVVSRGENVEAYPSHLGNRSTFEDLGG